MVGGTYTTNDYVRNLTKLGTNELPDDELLSLRELVDGQIENVTGRIWDGQQIKELIGRGDGTTSVYNVGIKPVWSGDPYTASGSVTDTSSHITVYEDGSSVSSTKYTLIGNKGRIEFTSGNEPSSGDKVEVTYYYGLSRLRTVATFLAAAYAFSGLRGGDDAEAKAWERRATEELKRFFPRLSVEWTF